MPDVIRLKNKAPVPHQIIAIRDETHDTKTFRFALPERATLDMFPGDHLYVHANLNGKAVKRPYTPSSLPETVGYFELTIKRYESGMISKHVHEKKIGDTVQISGPNQGGHWIDGMANAAGFVAGGTGITPMISIIRWILVNKLAVELSLIFANKTEADIMFRSEFDQAMRESPNFHCYHVLEQPPAGWSLGVGRITTEILRARLPVPRPDTVVFLCGPPQMVDALELTLRGLGYAESSVILP